MCRGVFFTEDELQDFLLDMSSNEETVPVSTANKNQSTDTSSHHIPDHEGGIHFTPPLYRQRYNFTLDLIQRDPSLHSVLDIGCGTCQLLTYGRYRNPHIQLIAAIDIIRFQLDEGCFRLKPLPVEYIVYRRETPLHMYILHGKYFPKRKYKYLYSFSRGCYKNMSLLSTI